jgi:hypothetical protein
MGEIKAKRKKQHQEIKQNKPKVLKNSYFEIEKKRFVLRFGESWKIV